MVSRPATFGMFLEAVALGLRRTSFTPFFLLFILISGERWFTFIVQRNVCDRPTLVKTLAEREAN